MKKLHIYLTFILGLFFCIMTTQAQNIDQAILEKQWRASWIVVPDQSPYSYGVYLFRKTMNLTAQPASFVVHVSADNRYKLFINEKQVSLGPARGDLSHWNFETVDIAPYLKTGKNIIAAQVWNEGEWKPEAQITLMTGFILQGATDAESAINTNTTWKCMRDSSYAPLKFSPTRAYYVSGAGEIRYMALHPKSWRTENFDDSAWKNAKHLFNGTPKNVLSPFGTPNGWMLVPSGIPQMEMIVERFKKLIQIAGDVKIPEGFPEQKAELVIPAQTSLKLLLDQTYLTNAYPTLIFSQGKNATINIQYAEALYSKNHSKGNRNETQEKLFIGRADSVKSDGTLRQDFTALTYRTYRYVQITITTNDEPLVINDIYGTFTGYPFELKSKMNAQSAEMDKMLEIGWRTARLCATETYMDCPYYEQLQYIGDARIQALVTLYNSGDEKMVKNALNLMDFSRQPEGITLSRHPSYTPQYIPTFSLWYIGMLSDYSRYGSDLGFVKNKLGGVRQILSYFKNYQQADGSLKNVPQWMFTDWVEFKNWRSGVGPMSADGTSAILDFQLLWAYQVAADLETQLGMPAMAAYYQPIINQLTQTIRAKYWDASKNLFADRAEKDAFSQHTNTLAILTGLSDKGQTAQIAQQLLNNNNLAPASIYFKYYLHLALIKAGLGNDYMKWLGKWRENIQMGLTTWAEMSDVSNSRSDCHAWGSSPNIEFYRTILGVDSDGLAFSKVKITPHLGDLTQAEGLIPHPKGQILVEYKFDKNKWKIRINLPETVTGTLIWKKQVIKLAAGKNEMIL